ncbi:hypothetical protein [Mycoplasma struthionis]|uniref:Uncharacterized protein n=1 Tax=Mycoplasma struthionis TaxID=538220 RepID=A0A3G8LGC0_9MOLU|nr:hypothetical protein [Mycoplasma struthionis]AZG68709.1 hypothetical protein EGN60_01895 [Mycoplasma struthionis]TPI01959.1 hypothetical protein FJM01_01760 [Mycoplasma struthionis]
MAKILHAQKQKDTRTLKYDPEKDNLSRVIAEFQHYKKDAHFYKDYSEIEVFSYFKEIRWMKTMDEKNENVVLESTNRQNKLKIKYDSYIEYEKWSDSPQAQKTRPLPMIWKIAILAISVTIIILMLIFIIALNKYL